MQIMKGYCTDLQLSCQVSDLSLKVRQLSCSGPAFLLGPQQRHSLVHLLHSPPGPHFVVQAFKTGSTADYQPKPLALFNVPKEVNN